MRSTRIALLCLVPFIFAGCQSVPKVQDPSGVSISVVPLTDNQVMMYYGQGAPFEPDPYIAPAMILSSHWSYVVLRVEIQSMRKAFVTLSDAVARDATGAVSLNCPTSRIFLSLLRQESTDDQLLNQLATKAERTYFPDGGVEVGPGRRSYAAVLVGSVAKPPLTVEAHMNVDTEPPRPFQVQWSN